MRTLILILLFAGFAKAQVQLINETFDDFTIDHSADSVIASYVFDDYYHTQEATGENALGDLSGNSLDMAAAAGFADWADSLTGTSPIYNGGNGLRFDGTDDYLYKNSDVWWAENPTLIISYQTLSMDRLHTICNVAQGVSSGHRLYLETVSDHLNPRWGIYAGAYATHTASGGITDSSDNHVLVCSYDGTNVRMFVDGVQYCNDSETDPIDYGSNQSHSIGNDPGGLKRWKGYIYTYALIDSAYSVEDCKKFLMLAKGWYSKSGSVTRSNFGFHQGIVSDTVYTALANTTQTAGYRWAITFDAWASAGTPTINFGTIDGGLTGSQAITTDSTRYTVYLGTGNFSSDSLGFWETSSTFYIDNVTLTEVIDPPTTAPTSFVFSDIRHNKMTASCTPGDGDSTMIVCREGVAPSNPVDDNAYTASSVFGSGSDLGSGSYVVAKGASGASLSVTVTNLKNYTLYYFEAWEYNQVDTLWSYLGPLSGNQRTKYQRGYGGYYTPGWPGY